MRNGGFGHIQKDRQVTYTHFVAVQCLHNTASGIITEDLKEFGHTLSLIFRARCVPAHVPERHRGSPHSRSRLLFYP